MKAIYFEEPVDQYACVERAWRSRLENKGGQAIFVRRRPGEWSGNPCHWSIKYLLSGQAAFKLHGLWCDVYDGFCFIVPEETAYQSTLKGGLVLSLFGHELVAKQHERCLPVWGVFKLTGKEQKQLERCLRSMEHPGSQNLPGRPDQGTEIVVSQAFPAPRAWQQCCRVMKQWLEPGPSRLGSATRLMQARHFLNARFRDHNVCEQAAEQASMTRSHFSREFSKLFGMSPRQYVVEYRTAVARRLLAGGSFTVEQVARRLGYGHASSLNHLFQRHEMGAPSGHL